MATVYMYHSVLVQIRLFLLLSDMNYIMTLTGG